MPVRLFVGNLPYNASAADIEQVFAQAGKVTSVSIVTDRATGQAKGFAFIDMGSKEEATAAIQKFDGREALGRILKVNEARPPERHDLSRQVAGPRTRGPHLGLPDAAVEAAHDLQEVRLGSPDLEVVDDVGDADHEAGLGR